MELSIYEIIVAPIFSNKAYRLSRDEKQAMLEVHAAANKPLVKNAVEKLFNVKVDSIRIMIRAGKRRISKTRNTSVDKTRKIAIVTCKPGYTLNFFNEVNHDAGHHEHAASDNKTE